MSGGLRLLRHQRARNLPFASLGFASVTVPANFLGMHINNPLLATGTADPPPAFTYGTYRSQSAGISWRHINTSNGVYDWSKLDAIINYERGLGHDICYTFYGTPQWAASITGTNGPYGGNGEASPPTSNATAASFITALLTRYNTGGVRKIKYIELWNEPSFAQVVDNLHYWWGTAAQLVATAKAVADAARAVDPGIIILSPGFDQVSPVNNLAIWLAANDGSGNLGKNLIDGVAFHAYYSTGYGPMSIFNGGTNYYVDITRVKAAIIGAGLSASTPIYCTEWGLSTAVGGTVLAQFAALSAAQRKARIGRTLLMAALQGVQFFGVYAYGSPSENLSGDLVGDTSGALAALVDIQSKIAGKTLTNATINQDGQITVLADSQLYSV